MFGIKELPFSYKDRRMEGVSSKGTCEKLTRNVWKVFVVREIYIYSNERRMESVCCK